MKSDFEKQAMFFKNTAGKIFAQKTTENLKAGKEFNQWKGNTDFGENQ